MRRRWQNISVQQFRSAAQIAIAVVLLLGGVQFVLWVAHFRYGTPYVPKPSSVGAFLPLSGLVGVKAWLSAGYVPQVHPAAFVIFVAVIATAVFFHRGVCSWLCPVGLLQEWVRALGIGILGRRYRPPWYLDYPLRAIKFLLLAFFLKVILVDFTGRAAVAFLQTDYNALSSVKLLDFWVNPSALTVAVVGVLVVATVFVEDVWCRYLCPYGALLSIIGWVSPASVTVERDTDACNDCGACTTACPNRIVVEDAEVVTDLECTRCAQCVSTCPEDALTFRAVGRAVSPWHVGAGIILVLFVIVAVGMLTGHWDSTLGYDEWSHLISGAETVQHPPYR